jgi:hypothetical protein
MATPTITVTVTVTLDENNSEILTVNQQEITLEHPDDWVLWTLEDPATSRRLAILFDPPVGPFQTVQSTSAFNLVGKGNKGSTEVPSASYHLYLIPEDPTNQTLVHGGPFTVLNESTEANPTPWLKATFTEGVGAVHFDSTTLLLFDGDLVFWEISGLTDDHIVVFPFQESPHFPGPFPTSLATLTPQTGGKRLGVATFNSCETGTFPFSVKVWDQNGDPVTATGDPSVDGLGRPPGT